jgi:hypothetical protein
MTQRLAFFVLISGLTSAAWAGPSSTRTFDASGEVVTVSPVYSRITIRHETIPGFSEAGETEFPVVSKDLIAKIAARDLVKFKIVDDRGDLSVTQIERIGTAPEPEKGRLGRALQETLEGVGEAAKTVASPIPPAGELVGAAADATTGATGSVLPNADPDVKQAF